MRKEKQFLPDLKDGVSLRGVMKKFKVTFRFHNDRQIMIQLVKANDYDDAEKQVIDMYGDDILVDEIFDVFDTPLATKYIHIDMPDGFTYAIPVMVIAENKGYCIAKNYDDDFYAAMTEEVLPKFESLEYEIIDWAKNNMNWSDVEKHAIRLEKKREIDYHDVWVNGEMTIK